MVCAMREINYSTFHHKRPTEKESEFGSVPFFRFFEFLAKIQFRKQAKSPQGSNQSPSNLSITSNR
jgi:hypothetical protein